MSDETFGSRLRRERERRQISLSSISENTKIRACHFEALERNDLSRWPTGIFRRAFIRAYAAGIGLDPDTITQEFFERFPDPAAPTSTAAGQAPTTAHAALQGSSPRTDTVLRLTLADAGTSFVRGRLLADLRGRCAAVGCDAAVMLAVATIVYVVAGSFWMPLGVFALLYELGGILIFGNTPGVSLGALTEKRLPPATRLRLANAPAAGRSPLADLRNRPVGAQPVLSGPKLSPFDLLIRTAGVEDERLVRGIRLAPPRAANDESRFGETRRPPSFTEISGELRRDLAEALAEAGSLGEGGLHQ
jgi:transcriptional regulator with XRE-family HTH domain